MCVWSVLVKAISAKGQRPGRFIIKRHTTSASVDLPFNRSIKNKMFLISKNLKIDLGVYLFCKNGTHHPSYIIRTEFCLLIYQTVLFSVRLTIDIVKCVVVPTKFSS